MTDDERAMAAATNAAKAAAGRIKARRDKQDRRNDRRDKRDARKGEVRDVTAAQQARLLRAAVAVVTPRSRIGEVAPFDLTGPRCDEVLAVAVEDAATARGVAKAAAEAVEETLRDGCDPFRLDCLTGELALLDGKLQNATTEAEAKRIESRIKATKKEWKTEFSRGSSVVSVLSAEVDRLAAAKNRAATVAAEARREACPVSSSSNEAADRWAIDAARSRRDPKESAMVARWASKAVATVATAPLAPGEVARLRSVAASALWQARSLDRDYRAAIVALDRAIKSVLTFQVKADETRIEAASVRSAVTFAAKAVEVGQPGLDNARADAVLVADGKTTAQAALAARRKETRRPYQYNPHDFRASLGKSKAGY